jgi:hypothetical protein
LGYVPDMKLLLHDIEFEEEDVQFVLLQWETGHCIQSHQPHSQYSNAHFQESAGTYAVIAILPPSSLQRQFGRAIISEGF